jgi:hypothetical protein
MLQPAQAEVVPGQLSTYLASWILSLCGALVHGIYAIPTI